MMRKLKIFMLLALVAVFPLKEAQAGLCFSPICIFKMILKMTPGLPVLDFSTLPPVIGQIPTAIQQKVQSEVKSMGNEMLRNVKTATKNPLDFKIANIQVPKAKVADVLPSADTLTGTLGKGVSIDYKDPADVSAASESLLVNPSGDKLAREKQNKKRKKFFEDNLFEAYAYSAQLQAQLTEMPQVLDDLISTATTDEDENQAYRANYTARQTMSKLLGVIQRTKATQLQLYASKDMGVNIKPKDAAIVAPALGKSLVGIGSAGDALDFAKEAVKKKESEQNAADKIILADLTHISDGKTIVQEAVEAHNMVADMQDRKKIIEKHKRSIERHDNVVEQLAENESCNTTKLATYYGNDASKAWSALTKWSQDMYSMVKASASLPEYEPNLSEGTTLSESETSSTDWEGSNKANKDKAEASTAKYDSASKGESAADVDQAEQQKRSEAYSRLLWDVGREALINLYANQSNWGTPVKEFEPWDDQKNIYEKYIRAYYDAIKARYTCRHGEDVANALEKYLPTNSTSTYKFSMSSDSFYYPSKYNSMIKAKHDKFMAALNAGELTYSYTVYTTAEDGTVTDTDETRTIPGYNAAATLSGANCSYIASSSAAPTAPETALPPYNEIIYLTGDDRDYLNKNNKKLDDYSRSSSVAVATLEKADGSGDFDAFVSGNYYTRTGNTISEVRGIYPETPSPWVKMFKSMNSGSATAYSSAYMNNYKYLDVSNVYSANYSELGDVSDSSGNIKEGLLPDVGDNGNLADAYTPGKLESNRISAWLAITEKEKETAEESNEAKLYIQKVNAEVSSLLSRIGYSVPANFDLSDEKDFNAALLRLRQYKAQKVGEAGKEIAKLEKPKDATVSQRLAELTSMINALNQDDAEMLQLSYSVAKSGNIQEKIKEAEANKVAVSTYEDNATASKDNEDFDPMCSVN